MLLGVVLTALFLCRTGQASQYVLWYDKPAADGMNEAVPIGNGRIGGLVYGTPELEKVIVNEVSLWTGDDNPSLQYGGAGFGDYQILGSLQIALPNHKSHDQYKRSLDIGDAVAAVEYHSNGVHYKREYLASHVANVLVAHLSADKAKSYTGSVSLVDSHKGHALVSANNTLAVSGALQNGLKYEWQITVVNTGGSLKVNGVGGNTIEFHDCDAVTLVVSAGTDYVMDSKRKFRGDNPDTRVKNAGRTAAQEAYNKIREEHVNDYHSLFNRLDIDLGQSSDQQKSQSTDKRRVQAFNKFDPDFEELFFQYGRYLMISSSRGSLPANLQGLWSDSNSPPWHADYHANINVQMNYWPAEPANLAECQVPLFDLITSQLDSWRQKTHSTDLVMTPAGHRSTRGVSCAGQHNIYGGMGIFNADGKPFWDKTSTAWYAQHFWWHYEFGLNRTYLERVAYPYMKEVVEFWDEMLKQLPNGQYVVPLGWSPEHGPVEDGTSYNQEIVWDLLTNFIKAADILGVDKDLRDKMATVKAKLHVPGIGSFGQLLEWMTEKPGEKDDHHRHTSHLFGVYPGSQFNFKETPALAKAALVSLQHRGIDPKSDVREWSFAWRTGLYARLKDAPNAYLMLKQMFSDRNSCPNLFGLHPPMQIDGNFGTTASVIEMLVHSHNSPQLELLPALPNEWPNGHIHGVRARGGYELDIQWADGKLNQVEVKGRVGSGEVTLVYGNTNKKLHVDQGKSVKLDGKLNVVN